MHSRHKCEKFLPENSLPRRVDHTSLPPTVDLFRIHLSKRHQFTHARLSYITRAKETTWKAENKSRLLENLGSSFTSTKLWFDKQASICLSRGRRTSIYIHSKQWMKVICIRRARKKLQTNFEIKLAVIRHQRPTHIIFKKFSKQPLISLFIHFVGDNVRYPWLCSTWLGKCVNYDEATLAVARPGHQYSSIWVFE